MTAPNIRAAAVVVGRATRCVMGNVSLCFSDLEPKERCICARIAKQVLEAATVDATPDPRDAVVAAAIEATKSPLLVLRAMQEVHGATFGENMRKDMAFAIEALNALRAALKGLGR